MACPRRRGVNRTLYIAILLMGALALAGCVDTTDDDSGSDDSGSSTTENPGEDVALPTPNPEQTGMNGPCLDYNLLWEFDELGSPLDPQVEVAPGTDWVASSADGEVQVDFFDSGGAWLDFGTNQGQVPQAAAFAILCVTLTNDYPGVPAPGATWVYQDGF